MTIALSTSPSLTHQEDRKGSETLKLQIINRQGTAVQDAAAITGAISGHLAGIDEEGRILFQDAQSQIPYPVVIGLPLSDDEVAAAAHLNRRALVIRTNEPTPQHVLVALLRERITAEARDKDFSRLSTHLNGRSIDIGAKDTLELQCGRARITLHADGRIEINGDYLLSRSRGPIKLKGATIDIN